MKKTQRIVSVVLSLLTIMALLYVPATTVSAAETGKKEWKTFDELVEEKGYLNGIQRPWIIQNSTGNDIGTSIVTNYGKTNYNDEMFYETFRNAKAMGFDIVQFWLTYQHGGILFDSKCQVIGLEPTFAKNLPRVFEIAEECGVYLCLGIINHTESQTYGYSGTTYRYEEINRFMHNEKQTKYFVDNWLTPVIEMTKDHENIIMANVFVEPEANGGRWGLQTGASWENLCKFMSAVNDKIHEINPRIKTFAGATNDINTIYKYYEDIDFDCYGYDFYSEGNSAHDTKELYLNKPLVYGEFGIDGNNKMNTRNDEFMTAYFDNYLDTIADRGVKAGFYWYYGFNGAAQSVVDNQGRPRPFTWSTRAWSLNQEYARTGYDGIDTPEFMHSTSGAIRWYGSRGATTMMMQRSRDGKQWETVLTFNPDDPAATQKYEFATLMYQWVDPSAEEGKMYYYRAVASDGTNTRASDAICIKSDKVTCSEEENLIKNYSFEEAPIKLRNKTNGKIGEGVDGWIICDQHNFDSTHVTNGTAGADTYTGTGSVKQITKLHQAVTLKPDTNYTLTFHLKYTAVAGDYGTSVSFVSNFPETSDADPSQGYVNTLIGSIKPKTVNQNSTWVRYTVNFNSGNITDTRLMFYSYQIPKTPYEWMVDDVYLFES